jgi:CDGSH-type Zn-finger protein
MQELFRYPEAGADKTAPSRGFSTALAGVGKAVLKTRVTPYRNGPYLIRGPFLLTDQDGNQIEINRPVVALCRCGRSQNRPFCDGTHKAIGFQAESGLVDGVAELDESSE